jgi:hypothetical protein
MAYFIASYPKEMVILTRLKTGEEFGGLGLM